MKVNLEVHYDNLTVKEYLKEINFSQKLYKAIKNTGGELYLNHHQFNNWQKLKKGDLLTLVLPKETVGDNITPVSMQLDIVYEDDFMLIINKPKDIAVIPTKKHFNKSLANGIAYYYKDHQIESNIHFVNRIDAATTGLLILAKSRYIHYVLTKDLKNSVERRYLAKVGGILEHPSGTINQKIAVKAKPSIKRVVREDGDDAITHYQVIAVEDGNTIVEVLLETGRTHQIRVHFSSIQHPIIGDKIYGSGKDTMFLHSYKIQLMHPITNKQVEIINYPDWFKR